MVFKPEDFLDAEMMEPMHRASYVWVAEKAAEMANKKLNEWAKPKEIHYQHKVQVFVPCFLNLDNPNYPTFEYSMGDATSDEQMAWSLKPDYVFKLEGDFDAVARSKGTK